MKKLATAGALALFMIASPALAQTGDAFADDPSLSEEIDNPEVLAGEDNATTGEDTATAEGAPEEKGGLFSRLIPPGLKNYFNEEEEAEFQARLDAAETPQQRNEVRKELQQQNQTRHLGEVQANKDLKQAERKQRQESKGLFATMRDDFKSIVSGEAMKSGADRASGAANDPQVADRATKDRAKDRSGNGGGRDKDRGGRGGGNGGGRDR